MIIVCVAVSLSRLTFKNTSSLSRIMSNDEAPGWDWSILIKLPHVCKREQKHACSSIPAQSCTITVTDNVGIHSVDAGCSSSTAQSSTIIVTDNVVGRSLRGHSTSEDPEDADASSFCSEEPSDETGNLLFTSAWKEMTEEELLELRASNKFITFMKRADGTYVVNENRLKWFCNTNETSFAP